MNLFELRTGIASTLAAAAFTSEQGTGTVRVTIGTHGGEYSKDAIQRYAQKSPAIIVSVLGCETDKTPAITFAGIATVSAFVFDRSHALNPRDESALVLVTKLLRVIAVPGQSWGLSGCLAAPAKIRARNLYTPDIDGMGIALWAVSWSQAVDLTDDSLTADDLLTLHADYDLGPEPDGVIEAQDDIDLT